MGQHGDAAASGETPEVAGYVVSERLGSGGFGDVFRARHAVIGRDVAIKVLHAKYSAHPEAVARFIAEARAAGALSHPGIVEVYDYGTTADGRQYCVMEYIRGTTLRDLLRERGRLPLAEALPILRGIAEAVDAAHAAGIVHRDLKPDNVFVLDGCAVKLIDFGLAKLTHEDSGPVTQSGSFLGTPLYMSPEQCRGKGVTLAADAYSFGATAYHVLVGEPPFSGEPLDLALKHLNEDPEPPSKRCDELDGRIDRVVLALLAKHPRERPTSLVAAVDALAGAKPMPGRYRTWYRRGGIAVGAALLVAAGVTAFWLRDPATSVATRSPCEPAARLSGIWDTPRQVAVQARILGLGHREAPTTWRMLKRELDTVTSRWSQEWGAACRSDERERDPLLAAERMACFDNVLLEMRGALAAVDEDTELFSYTYDGNSNITAVDDCLSADVLRAQLPSPPPELHSKIAEQVVEIHRASAIACIGTMVSNPPKVDEALARLDTAARVLDELRSPVAARARYVNAALRTLSLSMQARDAAEARGAIQKAIDSAFRLRDDRHLALSYGLLARFDLSTGAYPDDDIAEALRLATAALARAGRPLRAEAVIRTLRAKFAVRRRRFDEALAEIEAAVPLWQRLGTLPDIVGAHIDRSWALRQVGRNREAIEELHAAATVQEDLVGLPRHMIQLFGEGHVFDIGGAVTRLEWTLARTGELRAALDVVHDLLAIFEALPDTELLLTAVSTRQLTYGLEAGLDGEAEAARARLVRLQARTKDILWHGSRFGIVVARDVVARDWTHHVDAYDDDALAVAAYQIGDLVTMEQVAVRALAHPAPGADAMMSRWLLAVADARRGHRRAALAKLRDLAPLHARVPLQAYVADAYVWGALGRWSDAVQALTNAREHAPLHDLERYKIDALLGEALVESGSTQNALQPLEEAMTISALFPLGTYFVESPIAKFALARALWATDGDHRRARSLARQAAEELARAGSFRQPDRERILHWLTAHPEA